MVILPPGLKRLSHVESWVHSSTDVICACCKTAPDYLSTLFLEIQAQANSRYSATPGAKDDLDLFTFLPFPPVLGSQALPPAWLAYLLLLLLLVFLVGEM